MKGNVSVSINGIAWTENRRRKELPCDNCSKPTRGRLLNDPVCIDCGMAILMKPLASVRELLRGLFK